MENVNAIHQRPEGKLAAGRLHSLDVYRGLVMLLMMGEVLQFSKVAERLPESGFWNFLARQQTHTEWIGCTVHDLIQPSFSFLVGVALPFSLAKRISEGQRPGRLAWHAFWRSALLVLLGIFLRSVGQSQTYWTFEDTLTQIGLGYFFLFLLGFKSARWQLSVLALILVGYWAAFAFYPAPNAAFDYPAVGVPNDWPHLLGGFQAHWNKNSNLAWAFDTWFLNLFPRESRFVFNEGGYATLSFIPTLGTMILGLLAGRVLRQQNNNNWSKSKLLALIGGGLFLAGWTLGWCGICPVVKRIWTPSWVLFSGGWCFLILAALHQIIDLWKSERYAFLFVVVGMNSIAAYCLDHLCGDFITETLKTNVGTGFFNFLGFAYQPLVFGASNLLILWLILFWMHRRKLFLRI